MALRLGRAALDVDRHDQQGTVLTLRIAPRSGWGDLPRDQAALQIARRLLDRVPPGVTLATLGFDLYLAVVHRRVGTELDATEAKLRAVFEDWRPTLFVTARSGGMPRAYEVAVTVAMGRIDERSAFERLVEAQGLVSATAPAG